jgi:hypothetical protein
MATWAAIVYSTAAENPNETQLEPSCPWSGPGSAAAALEGQPPERGVGIPDDLGGRPRSG